MHAFECLLGRTCKMAAVRDEENEIEDRTSFPADARPDDFLVADETASLVGSKASGSLSQTSSSATNLNSTPARQEFEEILRKNNRCSQSFINKGVCVTVAFFIVAGLGFGLVEGLFGGIGVASQRFVITGETVFNNSCYDGPIGSRAGCFISRFIRAIGVFGFIGGLSNWIAVEMLFVKIPCGLGCGVFFRHYKEIRACLQRLVLRHVFDAGSLQEYVNSERSQLIQVLNLDERMRAMIQPNSAKQLVADQLKNLARSKEAVSLFMMGIDPEQLKLFLEPRLLRLAENLAPVLSKSMCKSHDLDVVRIQLEIEQLVVTKMPSVSAKDINQFLGLIVRKDLSWLVVYGCVAGAVIGFITEFATVGIEETLFIE